METKKHSTLNNYILTKTLGSGFNSKVKLGYNKEDGKQYAIKIIRSTEHIDSNIKAILNEAEILKKLDHQNIIKLLEVSDKGVYTKSDGRTKEVMFAVLQLAPGGEIFEFLANTGKFSEPVARFFFKQMVEALDHCHSQGFAHRDMKPENLLLDEEFNLLLADFGFATLMSGKDGSGKLRSILGTESYMAPEIHSKAPYVGTSVDLFAAGIILFIFITGHPPFNQAKGADLYYKLICMNNHDKFWAAHSRRKPGGLKFFSPEFINLMNAMLAFDPTQRPSISEIKAHPWYNGETATHEQIKEEFALRKRKVDKMLARAAAIKAKKEAIAAAKKNNNAAFHGVQVFRGTVVENASIENMDSGNFEAQTELLNELDNYPELTLKKEEAIEGVEDKMIQLPGTMYSGIPVTELFRYAVTVACIQGKNVEQNIEKGKIKFNIITDDSKIGIKMKLREDESGTSIDFQKTFGNTLEYWKKVNELKTQFETVGDNFLELVEKYERNEA